MGETHFEACGKKCANCVAVAVERARALASVGDRAEIDE